MSQVEAELPRPIEESGAREIPPVPRAWSDTGLAPEAVSDLTVKALYTLGPKTGREITDRIRLPFDLLDDLLLDLQHRRMVEVRGTRGHGRAGYVFDLTAEGRSRAREAMDTNQYVGAAPVPMEVYFDWVERQTVQNVRIGRTEIEAGFDGLILEEEFLDEIGPAINSARSMFLYGHSGNGKTALARAIAGMIGGDLFVPDAVELDGQTILVGDPVYHRFTEGPADEADDPLLEVWEHDRRFRRVARPVVFAGGELTLPDLDLRYDPSTKFYQAPFQMKANGGILIIDDLGRQQVSPRDLLNRWIVPLENRIDYLTLHTGHKFPVPFDCLVVFVTNLDPRSLLDEAFLRRIHYKIRVDSPTYDRYERILRECCEDRGIEFRSEPVKVLFDKYYERLGIEPRSCHPRDLVAHVGDIAKYLDVEVRMSNELVERAARSYFLDLPEIETGDA